VEFVGGGDTATDAFTVAVNAVTGASRWSDLRFGDNGYAIGGPIVVSPDSATVYLVVFDPKGSKLVAFQA
jgi:hypothetical protein